MAKKLTIRQRNKAKIDELLKQKVSSGAKGFLKKDFKKFVADELIFAANSNNRLIRKNETLQKRYGRFKIYYDKLFTTGLSGHALFTGELEKKAKKAISKGTAYYIKEKGIEKKVSYSELAYKIELLSHKLSAQHDVAFTKFKPVHHLIGKGKYKVVITIPDLKEIDFEEMTTEEILEWFDDNNVEIIISDPSKIKNKKDRDKRNKAKKRRQKFIEKSKLKYYRQWKKVRKKRITKKRKIITRPKRKK